MFSPTFHAIDIAASCASAGSVRPVRDERGDRGLLAGGPVVEVDLDVGLGEEQSGRGLVGVAAALDAGVAEPDPFGLLLRAADAQWPSVRRHGMSSAASFSAALDPRSDPIPVVGSCLLSA
jgi:hypothetical protein